MRKVFKFTIIAGLAQICAAILHLNDVTNVAQVNFLGQMTASGIICVVFGVIFLIQNSILGRIRK